MKMTARDIEVVKFLMNSDELQSVKQISTKLEIKERLVRYHLNKINQFLKENNIQQLEVIKRKGILLAEKENVRKAMRLFEQRIDLEQYQYSIQECSSFIILRLLTNEEPISSNDFEKKLNISNPTFRKYLSEVKKTLKKYTLELIHLTRKGYILSGKQADFEHGFYKELLSVMDTTEIMIFLKNGETYTKKGELFLFNTLDIAITEAIVSQLEAQEKEENQAFTDQEFLQLFIQVFFRKKASYLKAQRKSKEETLIAGIPGDFTNQLIKNVEAAMPIELGGNHSSFAKILGAHIRNLNLRIKRQETANNPIYEDFMEEHTEFVSFLKGIIEETIQNHHIQISNQELSLIAIYFVSEIKRVQKAIHKEPSILIICSEGRLISNVIANKIKELFYSGKITVSPVRTINQKRLNSYDVVLSTIPLPDQLNENVLYIDSRFTKEDVKKISEYLPWRMNQEDDALKYFGEIMEVISENCKVENWSQLEFELINVLVKKRIFQEKKGAMVNFTKESITIVPKVSHWEEAIDFATAHLISEGVIEERYREKIKENTRAFGPYMLIAPGVFFAHAGSEDGCKKDGISLVKFEKGVKILPNQEVPVDLIMTLAFKDSKTNYVLERTINFAKDKQKVERIRYLNDIGEMFDYLNLHFLV